MRIRLGRSVVAAASASVALLAGASDARAQIDANPPPPNLLVLLDTSGSFELMIDGCTPEKEGTVSGTCDGTGGTSCPCTLNADGTLGSCTWTTPLASGKENRWGAVLQALTGSLSNGYFCATMNRSSGSVFDSEYQITSGGTTFKPYDLNYYLPFHRPIAKDTTNACTLGPGWLPGVSSGSGGATLNKNAAGGNATDWPTSTSTPPIVSRLYPATNLASAFSTTGNCSFQQNPDGALTQAQYAIRFGLMTYDQDLDPGNGATFPGPTVSTASPFTGQWSYFGGAGAWDGSPVFAESCPGIPPAFAVAGQPCSWPAGCTGPETLMEVGARNRAAPPWEGRLMTFPSAYDQTTQLSQNAQVQKAIAALRPYGATPTAGMFYDAAYYEWQDHKLTAPPTPLTDASFPARDPYVAGGCRQQYILLLTDGAPNLDMRPSCAQTGAPNGRCPFITPEQTAACLYNGYNGSGLTPLAGDTPPTAPTPGTTYSCSNADSSTFNGQSVTTFVIGFAASQIASLAPTYTNCSQLANNSAAFTTYCADPGYTTACIGNTTASVTNPPDYCSCCQLQRIAYYGGSTSAYFADSSSALQNALAAIFARITAQQTTRSLPAYSPPIITNVNDTGSAINAAVFLSAFTPNLGKPWSGDLQRERVVCSTSTLKSSNQSIVVPSTDDFADNLGSSDATRAYIAFAPPVQGLPYTNSSYDKDPTQVMRPFAPAVGATAFDKLLNYGQTASSGMVTYTGKGATGATSIISGVTGGALDCSPLQLGNQTCGAKSNMTYTSTSIGGSTNPNYPYLTVNQAATVLMDFTFGQVPSSSVPAGAPGDFPWVSRDGTCQGGNPCPFGGIYHATPVVAAPPGSLLRDESYIGFRKRWNSGSACISPPTPGSACTRSTVVYAATNDGLLHAFDANVAYSTTPTQNELWAMLPPLVMPQLWGQQVYPGSNQLLLDSPLVAKDVVFDRTGLTLASASASQSWHTMLVQGYGGNLLSTGSCSPSCPKPVLTGGYYAVDVTNPDWASLTNATAYNSTNPNDTSGDPKGPMFRWQLTPNLQNNFPYFGTKSAMPAITTLFFNPGDGSGTREIGVAILPGGQQWAATSGASCERAIAGAVTTPNNYSTAKANWDATVSSRYRDHVRCWGNTTSSTSAVPGRSLVIARIDTGEILRVFARASDVAAYASDTLYTSTACGTSTYTKGCINDTPLDSPMVGVPAVFENDVGSLGKKVFVGDADGTVWRFDLSNTDPNKWVGQIFLDAYYGTASAGDTNSQCCAAGTASCTGCTSGRDLDGQPVVIPPALALDPKGQLVLDVATGNPDNLTTTNINFVYSVNETGATANSVTGTSLTQANVNWYVGPNNLPLLSPASLFNPGEQVTGPMTIFGGTLYFATFASSSGSAVCSNGQAYLWSQDFETPKNSSTPQTGGNPIALPGGTCTPPSGQACVSPPAYTPTTVGTGQVIPGVSIQSTPSCGVLGSTTDSYVAGASHYTPGSSFGAGTYQLFSSLGAKGTTSPGGSLTVQLPTPVTPTVVDSWATVLE